MTQIDITEQIADTIAEMSDKEFIQHSASAKRAGVDLEVFIYRRLISSLQPVCDTKSHRSHLRVV